MSRHVSYPNVASVVHLETVWQIESFKNRKKNK